jgi:transporter family protein
MKRVHRGDAEDAEKQKERVEKNEIRITAGYNAAMPNLFDPANKWILYALLAAVTAALVSFFGKIGMEGIDSDLATTVRSIVQMLFVVIIALCLGLQSKLGTIHRKAMLMIVLSGIAGGASWLFGFRALRLTQVSKVAPLDKLSVPIAVVLAQATIVWAPILDRRIKLPRHLPRLKRFPRKLVILHVCRNQHPRKLMLRAPFLEIYTPLLKQHFRLHLAQAMVAKSVGELVEKIGAVGHEISVIKRSDIARRGRRR